MELIATTDSRATSPFAHLRNNWERILPVVVAMLIIALAGLFYLPAYPAIEPYLHLWLVIGVLLFALVAFGADTTRREGMREEYSYSPEGYLTVEKTWPFATGPLILGFSQVIVAEMNLIWATVGFDYETTLHGPKLSLAVSLASVGFFYVLYRKRPSKFTRFYSNASSAGLSVLIALPVLMLADYFAPQLRKGYLTGPPAPWEKLLAFAQSQADRVENGAALISVDAEPHYSATRPYSSNETSFEIAFLFLSPSDQSIMVHVLDVDPPRLLNVKKNPYGPQPQLEPKPVSAATLRDYRNKTALIKLEPRDVYV